MTYLVGNDIESHFHNEQYSLVLRELIDSVKLLQEQVNDLRWRMNEVCNFISIIENKDE
jgi:hypothetical protein